MRTSAPCAILRVKSPPRLEPRDIQRFLEHGFAAKRRENASAPQNGISSQTQQGIPPQGFQNHIPARGRKHFLLVHDKSSYTNFKTISPQGDGNLVKRATRKQILCISKPYPRKGTETILGCWDFSLFSSISKPYPRKGTETSHHSYGEHHKRSFQNHIPARGRKHRSTSTACEVLIFISKPYPRKGTETCQTSLCMGYGLQFQNHIPARGRKLFQGQSLQHCREKISKPYPRKGTETFIR